MILVALDLATHTGCAIGRVDQAPTCTTEVIGERGASHGLRFQQVMRLTKRLITQHKPDAVIVEKAIASGPSGAEQRVQLAMGMRACVAGICSMHRVPFHEYPIQSIRKHFFGRGNLKRDAAKGAAMRRCRELGWNIANDNEADACAAWDYAREILTGKASMPGGLFDERREQART